MRGLAHRGWRLAPVALSLFAIAAGGCATVAPDRPVYGANDAPIWHPLTAYEQRALRGAAAARRGEWRALLRLALVASGDPRDGAGLREREDVVTAFLAQHRGSLLALRDHDQRGRRLLTLLHRDIFKTVKNGQLGRYDAAQSQLTVTLEDGTYNCISSALLYLVTARAVGLDARGASMPNHAFIELRLPDGRRIDVETTSRQGHGLRRSPTWFARNAGRWAAARGLSSATWAQYQRRRIVSPLRMVADNMQNQHTGSNRMAAAEIRRLRELRGALLPGDAQAQFYRLHALGFEHNEMHAAGEHEAITRMYAAVEPALAEMTRRHGTRASVKNMLGWHRGHYASALQRIGRWADAAMWLGYTERLLLGIPDANKIQHNILATAWREIQARVKRNDVVGARVIAGRWHSRCARQAWCRQNQRWLAQFR